MGPASGLAGVTLRCASIGLIAVVGVAAAWVLLRPPDLASPGSAEYRLDEEQAPGLTEDEPSLKKRSFVRSPMRESVGVSAVVAADGDLGFIEGRVVDEHGEPMAGALVYARRHLTMRSEAYRDAGVRSGASGRFRLTLPSNTRYEVLVEGDGRALYRRGWFAAFEGQATDVGDLRPIKGRAVRGRVTGPEGAPVSGARVAVAIHDPRLKKTISEEDGSFVLRGLPDHAVSIHAEAEGYVATWHHIVAAATDVEGATIMLLRAGIIGGRFRDRSGQPIRDLTVVLSCEVDGDELRIGSVETDVDGRFEFADLAVGRECSVSIRSHEFVDFTRAGLILNRTPIELDMTLERLPGVMVRVRDSLDGGFVPRASVTMQDAATQALASSLYDGGLSGYSERSLVSASFGLFSESGVFATGGAFSDSDELPVDPEPSDFFLPVSQAGSWRLLAYAPGYESSDGPVFSTNGQTVIGPLEVRLRREAPREQYRVQVIDADREKPIARASIRIVGGSYLRACFGVPALRASGLGSGLVADDVGYFALDAEHVRGFLETVIEISAPNWAPKRVPVGEFVQPSSAEPLTVKLERGGELSGFVTRDGKTVLDHPVILTHPIFGGAVVRTGGDGAYRARGLAPGEWKIMPGSEFEDESKSVRVDGSGPLVAACEALRRIVIVKDGDKIRSDIEIRDFGGSVRGAVQIDSVLRARYRVRLWPDAGGLTDLRWVASSREWVREVWSGEDGQYELTGVPQGDYRVQLASAGRPTPLWSARVSVKAGDVLDLPIEVETASLFGTVYCADGTPATGSVEVRSSGVRVDLSLISEDGTFEIVGIPVGRFGVVAQSPRGRAVSLNVSLHPGPNRTDIVFPMDGSLRVAFDGTPPSGIAYYSVERRGIGLRRERVASVEELEYLEIAPVSPGPVTVTVTIVVPADPAIADSVAQPIVFTGKGEVLSGQAHEIRVHMK